MIVLTTLFFSGLQVLLGILLPGLGLSLLFRTPASSLDREAKGSRGLFLLARATALGFVYSYGVFLAGFLIYTMTPELRLVLGLVQYGLGMGIGVLLLSVRAWRQATVRLLSLVGRDVLEPGNLIVLASAFIVGVLAVFSYPHVLDSSQMQWTRDLLLLESPRPEFSLLSSTGALGYSALIAPAGVLAPGIPLVTLASGFKVLLCVLAGIACILLVESLGTRRPGLYKVAFAGVVVLSYFGQYGLLNLGKDSSFGIVFSLLYIRTLFDRNQGWTSSLEKGLFLAVSVGCGVITIPYLFVISVLYVVFGLNKLALFRFGLAVVLLAGVPLAIALASMMHVGLFLCLGVFFLLGVACYFGRNIELTFPGIDRRIGNIVLPVMFLALLLASQVLMPVKVDIVQAVRPDGTPVVVNVPPLDGKMFFHQFLLSFDSLLPSALVVLGMAGMLLVLAGGRRHAEGVLIPLAYFPFAVISMVLVLARLKGSPFSGFNLWDMSRDIPLWYGGILFGLFCIVLFDGIEKVLPLRFRPWFLGLALAGLVGVHFGNAKSLAVSLHYPTTYTEIGGNKDLYFAELTQALQTIPDPIHFFVGPGTHAEVLFFAYSMYGKHVDSFRFSPDDPTNLAYLDDSRVKGIRVFLVIHQDDFVRLSNHWGQRLSKIESVFSKDVGEGFYELLP